jgi:hypothetical protein
VKKGVKVWTDFFWTDVKMFRQDLNGGDHAEASIAADLRKPAPGEHTEL